MEDGGRIEEGKRGRMRKEGKLFPSWISLRYFVPGNLLDSRTQDSKLRSRAL